MAFISEIVLIILPAKKMPPFALKVRAKSDNKTPKPMTNLSITNVAKSFVP